MGRLRSDLGLIEIHCLKKVHHRWLWRLWLISAVPRNFSTFCPWTPSQRGGLCWVWSELDFVSQKFRIQCFPPGRLVESNTSASGCLVPESVGGRLPELRQVRYVSFNGFWREIKILRYKDKYQNFVNTCCLWRMWCDYPRSAKSHA